MKKYIAIGHYKFNDNVWSVACCHRTKSDFRADLAGNEFVPYCILEESEFYSLYNLPLWQMYDAVKKKVNQWRKIDIVIDYIGQCYEIIVDKLNAAC